MTDVGKDGMTRRERDDLAKHVRKRARVEKTRAVARKAELRAAFEAQLAAIYTPDDDATFRELHRVADEAARQADAALAERCRELGIPERLRPEIRCSWLGRGENALAQRRVELRMVASKRLDAMEKAARQGIEEQCLAIEERLLVGGLTTATAERFLAELPKVAQLMPPLTLEEVKQLTSKEAALGKQRRGEEAAMLRLQYPAG